MNHHSSEKPELIFFRDTPKDLMNLPPLASSMQHLETSFLLLAMNRYPHALVSCGSAIESALKAAIKAKPNDRYDFKELLSSAYQLCPTFSTLKESDIKDFRNKRNKIIHYGFSPKDDEESAVLLLRTGYVLIEECYRAFFQFNLYGDKKSYGGLLPDLAHHLVIARKVYNRIKVESQIDFSYCFRSFTHAIRWGLQGWAMSDWQIEIVTKETESGWASWEYKMKLEQELSSNIFADSWNFKCPVCDEPDGFICEIDNKKLAKGQVILDRGVCVNCGFVIPPSCPYLAEELCLEQLAEAKPIILKEYGIS